MSKIISILKATEPFLENELSRIDIERTESACRKIDKATSQMALSHSGSWFATHALIYLRDFRAAGPHDFFDVEWGLLGSRMSRTHGDWIACSVKEVLDFIYADVTEQDKDFSTKSGDLLLEAVNECSDRVQNALAVLPDGKLLDRAKVIASRVTRRERGRIATDIINGALRKAPSVSRDSAAVMGGRQVPPHVVERASFREVSELIEITMETRKALRALISLFEMSQPQEDSGARGSYVFIGHGRREDWRALKDFLEKRLGLKVEEFSRISTAGLSTRERLAEMLGNAKFSFVVLTAEDEHGGQLYARENVVHELGLFQGRLGFLKAIAVVEEGCSEFSNIVGLRQVRFHKNDITSCFEEIRKVLEREHVVE